MCFKDFKNSKEGNQIAYALEIFNMYYATAEDVARVLWALKKKKEQPEKPFLSIFLNVEPNYEELLAEVQKPQKLDYWLNYIDFPNDVGSFKKCNGFSTGKSIFSSEQVFLKSYQDEMQYSIEKMVHVLRIGEFKIIRTAYNKIKHGLTFLDVRGFEGYNEHEYPFLILSTGDPVSAEETQVIEPAKEKEVSVRMNLTELVLANKETNIATRLVLLWYLILKFEETDLKVWQINHSNTLEWKLKVEIAKPLILEGLKLPNGKSPEIVLIGGEKR